MFCAFLHELWLRQNAEGDGSIFLRFSSVGRQHSFANAFHLSEDEEPIDAVDRDGREWRGVGLSQRPIWVLQVGFTCVYFFFNFLLFCDESKIYAFCLVRYFMGQLYEIATVFYNLDQITVRVLESKNDVLTTSDGATAVSDTKTVMVKYRLDFDNRDYVNIALRLHKAGFVIENIPLFFSRWRNASMWWRIHRKWT